MTLLHPGLARLLKLRLRARVRATMGGLRQPRKAVFFVVGLLVVALWILPSLISGFTHDRADPRIAREAAPLLFLIMWLMSLLANFGEFAIFFTPSEVDFLFTGPFTRRQILVYKLATTCMGMAFSALIFSAVAVRGVTHWAAAYVGMFLGFWFLHLLNMLVLLAGQTIASRAYTRVRKIILLGFAALLVAGAYGALAGQHNADLLVVIQRIAASPYLRYVTLPFSVFGHVTTATAFFPEMAIWAAGGLAIDAAMAAAVLLLDADFMETAADVSRRRYARLQRVRRGGAFGAGPAKGARHRWPRPPRIRGAGPIAWKQIITAVRGLRGGLLVLGIIAFASGIGFSTASTHRGDGASALAILAPIGVWLCIFLPAMIRFDFRNDLASIEWLKMLPISPLAIALGEIAIPVLLVSIVELVVVAGAAAMGAEPLILVAAAFLLPLNTILFSIENFFYLLWPTPAAAAGPGDFQYMGRNMVSMLVRFMTLALACGLAALAGFLAAVIAGGNLFAGLAAAWVWLTLEAAAAIPCVAWVYRRFDVSTRPPMD